MPLEKSMYAYFIEYSENRSDVSKISSQSSKIADMEMQFYKKFNVYNALKSSGYYSSLDENLMKKGIDYSDFSKKLTLETLIIYQTEGTPFMKKLLDNNIPYLSDDMINKYIVDISLFIENKLEDLMYSDKLLPNEKLYILNRYAFITSKYGKEGIYLLSDILNKLLKLK